MSRPLRVYIAGPLTAPTYRQVLENVESAVYAAAKVVDAGHYPFVPHFSWYVAEETETERDHDWWLDWCVSWIDHCDVVYRLGASPGSDMERDYAIAKGIPVVESLADLKGVG